MTRGRRTSLAANPQSGRRVLDVGALVRVATGGNPHRWYDPSDVLAVAGAIAGDLETLDPRHRATYAQRLNAFQTRDLEAYRHAIATIKAATPASRWAPRRASSRCSLPRWPSTCVTPGRAS